MASSSDRIQAPVDSQTTIVNVLGHSVPVTEIMSSDEYQWTHAILQVKDKYYLSLGSESLLETMMAIINKERISYPSYDLAAIAFKILYGASPPPRP